MTWYHGTAIEFEHFDADFIGHGIDQLGSGFYFTDRYETAYSYAAKAEDNQNRVVLVVELDIAAPLPDEGGFTRSQIEELLRRSPEFDDMLTNFGDVSFEGEEKVMNLAINTYFSVVSADALAGLNALSNDFYRGVEGLFLRNVYEVAGYDGLFRKHGEETHAVAWLPEKIAIVDRLKLEDEEPSLRLP